MTGYVISESDWPLVQRGVRRSLGMPEGEAIAENGHKPSALLQRGFTGYCDYGIGAPTQLDLSAAKAWIELDTQTGAFQWVNVPVFPSPAGKRYFRAAGISGDLYV